MKEILDFLLQAILIILVIGLVVFINILRFTVLFPGSRSTFYRIVPRQNLKKSYKVYLVKYLDFYNRLNPKAKLRFERRVQQFINMKQFIPRSKGMIISDEMKALISGTAVMVCYGFPQVYLRHFHRILVYSNNYYSTITRQYHKGEVNMRGIIVLSWESFKEGFIDRKDGINLGIHELSHALKLENKIRNEEYGFLNRSAINKFDSIAELEIERRVKGDMGDIMLREYSIVNKQEYFAVAAELFFENPGHIQTMNPELYSLLCLIFKVDTFRLHSI